MEVRIPDNISIKDAVKLITFMIGTIGYLSVIDHVALLYSLLFLAIFIVSVIFERKNNFLIPRLALNAIAVLFIIYTVANTTYDNLIEKTIEMFIFLLAVKFLENKKTRDYLQIYTISVFLLLGSALLSTDFIFLIYFLSLVFLFTIATILLAYLSEDPDLHLQKEIFLKVVSRAMLIPAVAIPLMAAFFVVLPRPYSPLVKITAPGKKAVTGFSEAVNLGEVSSIQEDTGAIFRVNMKKIDQSQLYWRGIVFDYFDGRRWNLSEMRETGKLGRSPRSGEMIEQTVFLEPNNFKYLFALDRPVAMNRSRTSRVFTNTIARKPKKRIRYDAVSFLSETVFDDTVNEALYLQLPEDIPLSIIRLAKDLSFERDTVETVRSFMKHFQDVDFKYSLEGLPVSASPLEDFLFDLKYGNCEYYASALAVMLRISGIPARVIGGYKGADFNEMGGYYLVQNRNAHVWVEAFIKGDGWVRLDPTPASREVLMAEYESGLIVKAGLLLDIINYYWNGFVIDYDLKKQFSLFMKLSYGLKGRGIDIDVSIDEKRKGVYFLVLIFIILFFFSSVKLIARRKCLETRVARKFNKRMARHGYERGDAEGLEEFVLRIPVGKIKDEAGSFVNEFERLYYKDESFTRVQAKRLCRKIRAIKPH